MGDRVATICGDEEGWDHFPFPVPLDAGLDTSNAGFVAPSLDRIMKWYWRVKKWHVEVSLNGAELIAFSADLNITTAPLHPFLNREAGLVTPPVGDTFWQFNDFGSGGDTQMTAYYSPRAGLRRLASGNFFFPFLIHCRRPDATVQNTMDDLEEGGHAPDAATPSGASLDGVTNTAYYFRGVGPALTASIIITPTEFWPYANSLGSTVYDTSTGIQLFDPLS